MADPLSLAAGSFAVVGVVDVVLRASFECCRFLSALKDAPEGIGRLQSSIETNKALVDSFKEHLGGQQGLAAALSATHAEEALKLFESSVKSFDRELSTLKLLATKYAGKKKLWGSIKYHLDDRKVNQSLRNLENAKGGLCAAFSLVGGPTVLLQRYIDSAVENGAQQMIVATESLRKDFSFSCQKQTDSNKIQKKILSNSKRHLKALDSLDENLRETAQATQIQHVDTRAKIAEGNQIIIDTIQKGFANIHVNPFAESTYGREIYFIGESKDALVDLLVLARTQVRTAEALALFQLLDIGWIQDELRTLINSAVQAMTPQSNFSTVVPLDRWISSSRLPTMNDLGRAVSEALPHCQSDAGYDTKSSLSMNCNSEKVLRRKPSRFFLHESSLGRLYLNTPPSLEHIPARKTAKEAFMFFIPSRDVYESSLAIRFLETYRTAMMPKLHVQLTTFRLIESPVLHWDLLPNGTVQQIDHAIRRGIISPYDQLRGGWIICFRIAGKHFRLDLLQYFQNQGAGTSIIDGEHDVLGGMWSSIQSSDLEHVSKSSVDQILAFLENHTPHITAPINKNALHGYGWHPRREVTEKRMQLIRLLLGFLKKRGYDFEHRDEAGRTPLFGNMVARGGAGLAIAKVLLELGANAHATDLEGRNAIQLAMCSNIVWEPKMVPFEISWREFTCVLTGKLELLINAGVNLEHKDKYGSTPCRNALDYDCWDTWCKALKRCGKSSNDVTYEGDRELVDK